MKFSGLTSVNDLYIVKHDIRYWFVKAY